MLQIVVFYVACFAVGAFAVAYLVERVGPWWRGVVMRRRVSAPAPASLDAGPAKLAGTVEMEAPGAPAITVRIRQTGTKAGEPGSRVTAWKEKERTVDARRFTLMLAGTGARIEVEPGETPRLFARSDVTTERGERTIVASVGHGERVVVEGVLTPAQGEAEGYREAPQTLVLRAREGGRVRVEAESAARELDGTAAKRRELLGVMLLFVVPIACAIAWHAGAMFRSETVSAVVSAVQSCGSMYKGTMRYDPCFTAVAQGPGEASIEFDEAPQPGTALRVGDRTDITFVRGHPGTFTVGRTLAPGGIVFTVFLLGLMVIGLFGYLLWGYWRVRVRWYDAEPFEWEEPR